MAWSKVGVVALVATMISLSYATPMPSPTNDPNPKPKSTNAGMGGMELSNLAPMPGNDEVAELDALVDRLQEIVGDMPLPKQEGVVTKFPRFPVKQSKIPLMKPIDQIEVRS